MKRIHFVRYFLWPNGRSNNHNNKNNKNDDDDSDGDDDYTHTQNDGNIKKIISIDKVSAIVTRTIIIRRRRRKKNVV